MAATVCDRLCQSITSREPRHRATSQATASVGTAGGFCTSTTSAFGNRINSVKRCRACPTTRASEPATKRLRPPVARP